MRPSPLGTRVALAGLALGLFAGLVIGRYDPPTEPTPAVVVVAVPEGATLYFDDYKSTTTGEKREFETPPLPPGKPFHYIVKGTWTDKDGKPVTRTAKASVTAGEVTTLDLFSAGRFTFEDVADLSLNAGEKKSIKVRIKRDRLEDPVAVSFAGLPAKVVIKDVTIGEGKEEVTVEVVADKDAADGTATVKVQGSAAASIQKTKFNLTVKKAAAPPPPTAGLKLVLPATLEVEAGAKKDVPVKITRQNFDGEVRVTFGSTPNSKIIEVVIPKDKAEGVTTLEVAAQAPEGPFDLKATAEGGGAKAETVTKVTVKKAAPKPAVLKLDLPTTLDVEAGGKKGFTVKVKRENLEDPVTVKFDGLPKGTKIADVTIAADKAQAEAELTADKDAADGSAEAKASAKSGDAKAEAVVKVTVKAAPKPAALKLEVPVVEVGAGEKKAFNVKVTRENYPGPVELTFDGLPKGVKIAAATIAAEKNEVAVEAAADKDAAEGAAEVKVAAKGGTAKAEAVLKLTVKSAPKLAAIKLDAPPMVVFQAGDAKSSFPVKVVRENYDGSVTLKVTGQPATVKIADVTVDKGKNDAVVEATVAKDATVEGPFELKISATGGGAKAEFATKGTVKEAAKPKPAALKLEAPATLEVATGDKKGFTVKVSRENLEGTATVKFDGLPPGVKIADVTLPQDKTEGAAEVVADKDAAVGTADVKATAKAGAAKAEAAIKLTVKGK